MVDHGVIVLEDNFDAVRDAVTGAMLMEAAKAGGHVVEGEAKLNASKGGDDHLNIGEGTLTSSIEVTKEKQTQTLAEVGIGTNIIYARIHELGGIIKAVSAKMLSWIDDAGNRIFANLVHMPARPYLRPAMDENEDKIVKAVETEIWRNLKKATD